MFAWNFVKFLIIFGANWDHKNGHKYKKLDQMQIFMIQIRKSGHNERRNDFWKMFIRAFCNMRYPP